MLIRQMLCGRPGVTYSEYSVPVLRRLNTAQCGAGSKIRKDTMVSHDGRDPSLGDSVRSGMTDFGSE